MENRKRNINVVAMGEEKTGKSTLLGRLIYSIYGDPRMRHLDNSEIAEEILRVNTNKYASYFDSHKDEQRVGRTITCHSSLMETNSSCFTVTDVPGASKLLKNLVRGAVGADLMIFVVDANLGFESDENSMSYQQFVIAYALGIKNVIVCVNKMEERGVNFSEEVFNDIVKEITKVAKRIGFDTSLIPFIPISALYNINLTERDEESTPWFKGNSLINEMNKITAPKRATDLPFRFIVKNDLKIKGIGRVFVGSVLSGELSVPKDLTIEPLYRGENQNAMSAFSTEIFHHNRSKISAGDYAGINLRHVPSRKIRSGAVLGFSSESPPLIADSFVAQILVLGSTPKQIIGGWRGYTPPVYIHAVRAPCIFSSLIRTVNKKNGKVIEENPKFIKQGDCAIVEMKPKIPICVEPFDRYPQLGRFFIKEGEIIIAIGRVISVTHVSEKPNKPKSMPMKERNNMNIASGYMVKPAVHAVRAEPMDLS